MSDREQRLRTELAEVRRRLADAEADRDTNYQIALAARAGCAEAGERLAVRTEAAEREAAAARRAQQDALIRAADALAREGRIYSRLRRVDRLLDGYAARLPAEFVTAVRRETQPGIEQLIDERARALSVGSAGELLEVGR